MCVLVNTYQQALSSEIYFMPATVFDFKFQCTQHSHINTMFLDFNPFHFYCFPASWMEVHVFVGQQIY